MEDSKMKRVLSLFAGALAIAALSGCLSPKGETIDDKKATAQKMRDDTMEAFFIKKPELKQKVANAAGYAVFKNMGIQIFIPSTESGWGYVYNNATGEKTYMKLFSLGAGFGIGIRDFRALYVFSGQDNIKYFIDSGWGINAQANAALVLGDAGGGAAAAGEVLPGISIYKFTENGIVLQATLQGSKIWGNDTLNGK
jgi:lipid-binding SYLF domain-containing protein